MNDNKGTSDAYGVYAAGTTNVTYTGNKFDNGQYGIETDYPTNELLTGNTTSDNSENGIYVYTDNEGTNGGEYSAALNDNTANDNRFGLYSQLVTSGSGNHATGNKVVNCYQVSC